MLCERLLHFIRAGLERLHQVTMPILETIQYVSELAGNGFRIERDNPVDDMVCAHLVGRVQNARFGRRLERPHDHPRGIGAQGKRLPFQGGGLRQGVLGSVYEEMKFSRPRREVRWVLSGWY